MIKLWIPAPCEAITSNQRHHWSRKAQLTRRWRSAAHIRARQANVPKMNAAQITILLAFPDHRRRDPSNWAPTGKAVVDGLVDYGMLPDDDKEHLLGPDMRAGYYTPKAVPGAPKLPGLWVNIDPISGRITKHRRSRHPWPWDTPMGESQ